MTNQQHSDTNLLIAEYTLGLLDLQETAAAQTLLGQDAQAVVNALKWEQALLELTDRLEPVALPPGLWQEISNALDLDYIVTAATTPAPTPAPVKMPAVQSAPVRAPSPPPSIPLPQRPEQAPQDAAPAIRVDPRPATPPHRPSKTEETASTPSRPRHWWHLSPAQIAFLVALIAVAVLAIGLIPKGPPPPEITVVEMAPRQAAILQAPNQSSTPGWVVTVTPEGNVLLHPRVRTDIPADASVQLWTYSKSLPTPRSLGLIDPNQPVTVPAELMGEISEDQFFEMTQEAQGGSASAGPVGPVLFIGRLVTFGQPPAPSPSTGLPPTGSAH